MNDEFMQRGRREPDPEFARRLAARLRLEGEAAPVRHRARLRLRAALGLAVAVAMVGLLAGFPWLRASAQAFLDLFRIRNFAAVTVDPARIEQLRSRKIDVETLLGDRVEKIHEPGPPRIFDSPEAAGAAAGMPVREPASLPAGFVRDTIEVRDQAAARVTIDSGRLRELMEALEIRDLSLPPHLDGTVVTVRVPPAVGIHYRRDRRELVLVQARSPEVSLPQGLDLAQLGEIGLRIVGLSPAEAKRFARAVDWHSTLLVPVPSNASSFSEVHVHGQQGLLISTTGTSQHPRRQELVLWSEAGTVYALMGQLGGMELIQTAESIR